MHNKGNTSAKNQPISKKKSKMIFWATIGIQDSAQNSEIKINMPTAILSMIFIGNIIK